MKPIVRKYFEQLKAYCNKYDNIIMNQMYALGGPEEILLSDIYSDFDLVSKNEYDRNIGIKDYNQGGQTDKFVNPNSLDIDKMMHEIDMKLYELNVSELLDKPEINVKKSMIYIYVKSIDEENNDYCKAIQERNNARILDFYTLIKSELGILD